MISKDLVQKAKVDTLLQQGGYLASENTVKQICDLIVLGKVGCMDTVVIPAKARYYVFTGVGLSVCLFVTTITK